MSRARLHTITILSCILCVPGLLLPAAAQAQAADLSGYGPWKFGMTPAEVEAVSQFGPYAKVPSTGGLETPNGEFGGQKTHISFVFRPAGLYHIQLWLYQGESFEEAVAALHRAYVHLGTAFGPLNDIDGRLAESMDAKQLAAKIGPEFSSAKESLLPRLHAGGTVQVHTITYRIAPVTLPAQGRDVHADLLRSPELGLYYVFLYYRAPLLGK
jgi:hypothetical protein